MTENPKKPTPNSLSETAAEDRDPVEALAAEYSERRRLGERVSIEEYASQHPHLAEEIRELFPTIDAMERLNAKRTLDAGFQNSNAPEQLGDYRVVGEIARGGMGIVYEAEQISLGRRVAVKVLPQHALRRPRDIRRFEREAQTAAQLHHSNIVPVFGVGQDHGHHYIVMQLIRGVGLDEILAEMKYIVTGSSLGGLVTTNRTSTIQRSAVSLLEHQLRRDTTQASANEETQVTQHDDSANIHLQYRHQEGPAPTPQQMRAALGSEYYRNVARIGLQAAQALQYAHSHNTLHRDVKPGNLLLDDEGCVWMADFGLAKAIENDSVTGSGDIVGTLAYVAPERFRGETTPRSDLYSLGITLYEMLTLQKAFDAKDRVSIINQVANEPLQRPRRLNPDVPKDLETIVMKAAAQEPGDRYATAADVAADLDAFLADRPISARPLSAVEHTIRWCRRNRTTAALSASVIILLVAGFAMTVAGFVHADRQRRTAETTSRVAMGVLDEIYNQFAANDANVPVASSGETGEEAFSPNPHLPLSKDVAFMLENLLRFYDEVPQQGKDTTLVDLNNIASHGKVGEIQRRLGQLEKATHSYEDAIARIERLDPQVRSTKIGRLESARIYNGLGMVQLERRQADQSIAAHQEAIRLLGEADSAAGEQFELARSLYLLHRAQVVNRSRRPSGESLSQAKSLLTDLTTGDPNNSAYSFLLARCLLASRSCCSADGALNREQTQAVSILERLVKQFPDSPDYQFELGEAYSSIEWNECRRNKVRSEPQLTKAEQRLRRGLEVTSSLDINHPNIPQYHHLKKHLHRLLGEVLKDQQRIPEAAEQYRQAIEKQRSVVALSPAPTQAEYWLLVLQARYGNLLRQLDQPAEARELLETTVDKLEAIATEPEIQSEELYRNHAERTLNHTYVGLSQVLKDLGDDSRSQAWLERAERMAP